MKRYECFKIVRDTINKFSPLIPNDALSVGIYSVYDMEREIFNPPFSSDDLSAVHVFMNACIDNNIAIGLFKVCIFNTNEGTVTMEERKICDSIWIREIIEANGGIEE